MADDQTQPRAALITGAGRRIGRAIALALSRAGYAVVLHAHRSRSEAEDTANEIAAAGGRASIVLADLADAEALRGLIPAAAAFGPLALLVKQDLDPLSIAELETRIATLESEIARIKNHIQRAVNHRASADALFKR